MEFAIKGGTVDVGLGFQNDSRDAEVCARR